MNNYADTLNKIVSRAINEIQQLDINALEYKPASDKWSKKELIGHLVDSAYNNHQRFLRAEDQGNLIFQGYQQDEWVRKNRYQQRNVEELLNFWLIVNHHLGILIEGLPASLLHAQTMEHNFDAICFNLINKSDHTSLSYLIWDYLEHLEYHIGQIIPNYNKINPAFVG